MLFYTTLFLLFLYFKIARIYRKEEKSTPFMLLQNIAVMLSALATFSYGFLAVPWYFVLLFSFLFFIVTALMVTVVQLGIFVDGKPQFGISKAYKVLPVLTVVIIALSAIIWL